MPASSRIRRLYTSFSMARCDLPRWARGRRDCLAPRAGLYPVI
ncbi:hypothetical protein A33M_2678 [Rhodovulum sp. PH10]|nr:hypothetical protein A33M_2678 [Rhodovulum sp. PH10]